MSYTDRFSRFYTILQSYFKVKFFGSLDLVAVSAYFRTVFDAKAKEPNYDETVALFKWRATRMQRWLDVSGLSNKGVLIAEVGFQSKGMFCSLRIRGCS